ncbi:MAG TPA: hypothetical protein VGI16_13285 [Candidatus Acidoferrum sp.]|jgi:hypothetical protein
MASFALPFPPATSDAGPQQSAAVRDGQHDFDFNIGVWHTHIKRILDPLSGSTHSIELNGTVTVRKVWDGRAQLEEIEAEGPNGHWEGLTLFLYNPQSHQWSQTFANSKQGVLTTPLIGAFKDGRGELFSQDTVDGKSILVHGVWSDINSDSHRYEESYSDNGGKTWSAAFLADLTREAKPSGSQAAATTEDSGTVPSTANSDGPGDFNFDFGAWKTHTSRLIHPLTGSKEWFDMEGITRVEKVWNGRGNLAVLESDGPKGHLELLALRLYDPQARQWNVNFSTSNVGALSVPCIGEFKNGHGEFYDQEQFNGRTILVRFTFQSLSPESAQSEQAFSNDGGKTWEVNWINKYTRLKDHTAGSN